MCSNFLFVSNLIEAALNAFECVVCVHYVCILIISPFFGSQIKRPETNRPETKRPWTKRPWTKRPCTKRPCTKRPVDKTSGGTKRPVGQNVRTFRLRTFCLVTHFLIGCLILLVTCIILNHCHICVPNAAPFRLHLRLGPKKEQFLKQSCRQLSEQI
jgi:hypothetical protein